MNLENMGINIKNLREKKNISQEKLAAKCNLSKQAIYLLEKGRNKNPGIKQLESIANCLDVPLDRLTQ